MMERLFLILTTGFLLCGAATPARAAGPSPAVECPSCQDYNSCTVDTCDTTTGTCRHDPLDCDDRNPCTIDSCEPSISFGGGCHHLPVATGGVCEDGNSCTVGDACDGSGHCLGRVQPAGTGCDDGNSCTSGDVCDDGGRCTGASSLPGSSCDDGSLCTSGDTCVATSSGSIVCQGAAKDCADGDLCTVDSCDPSTGQCRNAAATCDDGNACTADACDAATGACQHANVSGACDDGNYCTTGDSCSGGNCIGGGPTTACDDHISCTVDTCVPGPPYCYHRTDSSLCGPSSECFQSVCDLTRGCVQQALFGKICHAGNYCFVGMCTTGGCHFDVNLCNDGNQCTADTCVDPAIGTCGHANLDGSACNDGNACTTGDLCGNGACLAGAPTNCDDGDPCTLDGCDTVTGCTHTPQPSSICPETVINFTISRTSPVGKGSGMLFWTTNREVDLSGFNVVEYDAQGTRIQMNTSLIACKECVTGLGSSYLFIIPKHKGSRGLYIELVHQGGAVELFGPATKQ